MFSTLLLGATLLAAPPDTARPDPDDLRTYESAREKVAGDAGAHVRLALWCEQHGLNAERVKHLALAVLTDPKNATARGLMGLVDYAGRWERPESVAAKVRADEELTAKLAEYNGRRERLRGTAEAHAGLAHWCEENGLAAEAGAHHAAAVRIDPALVSSWKALGMKKVNGRWVTPDRLAEEKAEAEAQRQADRRYKPQLSKLRGELRGKDRGAAADALERLDGLEDFRAVPSVWAVFATGDESDQMTAVRVLGHVEAPAANRALAALSVYSESSEVRRSATEVLRRRDGRDYIGLLIDLIRTPVRYEIRPSNVPDLPGELFIEGERAILRRVYFNQPNLARALAAVPPRLFDNSIPIGLTIGFMANASSVTTAEGTRSVTTTERAAIRRDAEIAARVGRIQTSLAESRRRLAVDVAAIESENAQILAQNERTLPVLTAVAGQDLGTSPEEWKSWWADQQGYVYEQRTGPTFKPVVTEMIQTPGYEIIPNHSSCFAAGTPVRTLDGLKPIEEVRVGDRVLSQDLTTGRLSYTAVVAPIRNKPAETFRVKAGGEVVVATAIHRFWKAGRGWAMTRDLKPGDVLRTAGGLVTVESIEPDRVQDVFNLEVAEGQNYFVGSSSWLVHDHTPVRPVASPFDAPVSIAEVVKAGE